MQDLLVLAIRLAQQSLHPVAIYRTPDVAGDGETDAVAWKSCTGIRCTATKETPEECPLDFFTMLKYKRKVFLPSQNFGFSESMLSQSTVLTDRWLSFIAHGQFPASFRTPPCKNFPAIFRFHPVTKPVFVFSLDITRLKCSLHAKTLRLWIVLYRKKGLSFTILLYETEKI